MLNKLIRLHLPLLAFLVPLFFLPATPNFFGFNKAYLIFAFATSILIFTSLKIIQDKAFSLYLAPSATPLLILTALFLLSSFIQSPTTYTSLINHTALFVSFAIIFLGITSANGNPKILTKQTILALAASLGLASVIKTLAYTGVLQLASIAWLNSKTFDTLGGPLPFLSFTLPLLPILIYLGLKSTSKSIKFLTLTSASLGIVATTITLIPLIKEIKTAPLALLPFSAGWAIAVDTLKNLRTGLLGTGPNTYLQAFTKFRPAELNVSPVWNIRFTNSSSFILTLLTTVGLPAATAFIFSLFSPLAVLKKTNLHQKTAAKAIFAGLLLHSLLLFLIPENATLLSLTFIFLILANLFAQRPVKTLSLNRKPFFASLLISLSLLFLSGAFWFFAGKTWLASHYTYKALQTLSANAIESYNYQGKAYNLDPYNPAYRINFSQTSLGLANTLAGKENLSDQDKDDINQLIQQSIREAKNATNLNPNNVIAWENLAQIYRQLISFVDGAKNWTIASYQQAIFLDPTNPQLKLDVGGLFLSLGDPEEAIKPFSRAVELKPNWANAYYNLSAAYKANKSYSKALEQMRVVIQLVDPTSDDYQKANDELKALEKLLEQNQAKNKNSQQSPAKETGQNLELVVPSPIPSPIPDSQIVLPKDAGPQIPSPTPKTEATPTP